MRKTLKLRLIREFRLSKLVSRRDKSVAGGLPLFGIHRSHIPRYNNPEANERMDLLSGARASPYCGGFPSKAPAFHGQQPFDLSS